MHDFKNENGYVSQLSSTTFHGLDGPLVHNQPARTILVPVGQTAVRPASQKATISNKILTALPDEDFERLASGFEPVSFSSRQDVREFDGGCCFVYFPQTLVVSQLSVLNDGSTAEVAMIGSEGMVGLSVIFNSHAPEQWARVLFAGSALRVRAESLKREFDRGGALQQLLLDYAGDYVEQVSQRAVCNSQHKIEERFASWLLMTHDRARSDLLPLTQEQIARRLGTRRSSITLAATLLQDRQIIGYLRGRIRILNRQALERAACECYEVISHKKRNLVNF